jgi:hypothetical protein
MGIMGVVGDKVKEDFTLNLLEHIIDEEVLVRLGENGYRKWNAPR